MNAVFKVQMVYDLELYVTGGAFLRSPLASYGLRSRLQLPKDLRRLPRLHSRSLRVHGCLLSHLDQSGQRAACLTVHEIPLHKDEHVREDFRHQITGSQVLFNAQGICGVGAVEVGDPVCVVEGGEVHFISRRDGDECVSS